MEEELLIKFLKSRPIVKIERQSQDVIYIYFEAGLKLKIESDYGSGGSSVELMLE